MDGGGACHSMCTTMQHNYLFYKNNKLRNKKNITISDVVFFANENHRGFANIRWYIIS